MKETVKYFYTAFASLIIIIGFGCNNNKQGQQESGTLKGTVSLSGAFALYPMAVKWKEEYNKLYPDVKIEISGGGAGKGIADALSGIVDLGMVSRDISQTETDRGAWYIPIVKDAVIGLVNSENPVLSEIKKNGMMTGTLKKIYITNRIKTWGEAIGNSVKSNVPLQVYTRSDACGAADTWAKFLGKKQEDLLGVGVFGDPGMVQAVQNDKYGIGYSSIGFAYNTATRKISNKLAVIPLDLNNNYVIDKPEDFYINLDSLLEAIDKNIYPSPPGRDLYLVSKGKPQNRPVLHFLNWILTDGQKYIKEAGFIKLNNEIIQMTIKKIK